MTATTNRSKILANPFRSISTALVLLGTLPLISGCELSSENKETIRLALTAPIQTDPQPGIPPIAPSCFIERFVQPDAQITKKLDLLFVTDSSGSLDEEKDQIAQGIDAFVGELPSDLDYQIAVMPAHSSKSQLTGRFFGAPYKSGGKNLKAPEILSSQSLSLSTIRDFLRLNLTKIPNDYYGDGGELGFYSLAVGLTHRWEENLNKGFFRSDAALAVVFISDEQDICYDYPEGVVGTYDVEKLEAPAKARDCKNVTSNFLLDKLKAHQKDRPLLVGGIVYTNEATMPVEGENELGRGYLDLISLSNGIAVDLADGDYDKGLAEIGKLVTIKLNLVTEFQLARGEVDAQSVSVKVDGSLAPFVFQSERNEVQLERSDAGIARSVVDVLYCLKAQQPVPEPTPSPSVSPTPSPTPTPTPSPEPTIVPPPVIIGV